MKVKKSSTSKGKRKSVKHASATVKHKTIVKKTIHQTRKTTKVFKSGNSQAVRLPKEFQLNADEVEISRRGNELIISEKSVNLSRAFHLLTNFSKDYFSDGRNDTPPQARDF